MDSTIIPIFGMMIPIIIVPVALGLKHARLVRQFEHAERMQALKLGRTLPRDEPWWTPARICVAIGAGVPVGAMLCAWLASESLGHTEEIWAMSGAVALTSVISGSILAGKHFNQRARLENSARLEAGYSKPPLDADAYDVVGSRG